jgi:pimeloyl-ACP methyl ester carboxylesterase
MNIVRAAGWWTADYTYAAWWQMRAIFSRADASAYAEGTRAPVLILPGIYESWEFMLPLVRRVHELGHPIHVVSSLRLNLLPVPEAAALVRAYLEERDLRDVIIVAHSKGGLIGKHVMIHPDAGARIDVMLAVATPFRGSVYSLFMIPPSLRIFSPRNATIKALALELDVNARIVSVYGRFDPHIPATSELASARNVELPTGGHFRILSDARVVDEFVAMVGGRPEAQLSLD